MARSYQVSVPPGSRATIADMVTMPGGSRVLIQNTHATEPLYIGGDENERVPTNASLPTLTVATGYRVVAGGTVHIDLNGDEVIYGRSGTSTVTISVVVFRSNFRGA